MEIKPHQFGLIAESQRNEPISLDSLPIHSLVAVELPKYLRVGTTDFLKEVEGHLMLDVRRNPDNKIVTVFSVKAKCIRALAPD